MVNLKSEFWSDKYSGNISLTNEMIGNCEKLIGFKLPEKFITLLKDQNGGYTNSLFINDEIIIDEIFGIYFYEENPSILDTDYLTKEWSLPQKQVLISGDGHTWISLDYSSKLNPSVRFINIEDNKNIILSSSFNDFLCKLQL